MVQAHIEPDGAVERTVLVGAEPRELVVESLPVLLCREVILLDAPVGNRARHAVDELLERVFALAISRTAIAWRRVTIEILRCHHVDSKRAPARRELYILLLENRLAFLVADSSFTSLPLEAIEGMFAILTCSWRMTKYMTTQKVN